MVCISAARMCRPSICTGLTRAKPLSRTHAARHISKATRPSSCPMCRSSSSSIADNRCSPKRSTWMSVSRCRAARLAQCTRTSRMSSWLRAKCASSAFATSAPCAEPRARSASQWAKQQARIAAASLSRTSPRMCLAPSRALRAWAQDVAQAQARKRTSVWRSNSQRPQTAPNPSCKRACKRTARRFIISVSDSRAQQNRISSNKSWFMASCHRCATSSASRQRISRTSALRAASCSRRRASSQAKNARTT
mmetsp:Transcript_81337/g.263880  ORF Transcript_81337/g.263880 Transcript_81337/m.263880 type:complete len:251 (-) Transcript_81337:4624-5376(-)